MVPRCGVIFVPILKFAMCNVSIIFKGLLQYGLFIENSEGGGGGKGVCLVAKMTLFDVFAINARDHRLPLGNITGLAF